MMKEKNPTQDNKKKGFVSTSSFAIDTPVLTIYEPQRDFFLQQKLK